LNGDAGGIINVRNRPLNPPSGGVDCTRFTNRDMINSGNSDFYTDGFDWDSILRDNDVFEQQLLETGRLPDGEYELRLTWVEDDLTQPNPSVSVFINIDSPTSILLISPGTPIGLGSTSISDLYPTFVWYSNMESYTFRLYQLDDEFMTPDDIEQLDPYFEYIVANSTNLPYPSDAPSILENEIYAWQIMSEIETPFGSSTEMLKSDMYIFNTFNDGEESMDNQVLMNFLYQLNLSNLDELMQLLESGYKFDTIVWKGREVTSDEIMELLREITTSDLTPTKASVE